MGAPHAPNGRRPTRTRPRAVYAFNQHLAAIQKRRATPPPTNDHAPGRPSIGGVKNELSYVSIANESECGSRLLGHQHGAAGRRNWPGGMVSKLGVFETITEFTSP
jgi:hypothetical protein